MRSYSLSWRFGREVASELHMQHVANTTWAFAVVNCRDEKLSSGTSEFNLQTWRGHVHNGL